MKHFLLVVSLVLISNSISLGEFYPLVCNNLNPPWVPTTNPNDSNDDDDLTDELKSGVYILIRNELHDVCNEGFMVSPYDDENYDLNEDFPTFKSHNLLHNASPRTYLVGKHDPEKKQFVWSRPMLVLPRLSFTPGVTRYWGRSYKDEEGNRIGNLWHIENIPDTLKDQQDSDWTIAHEKKFWKAQSKYFFTLSPPPDVRLFKDKDLGSIERLQKKANAPDATLVQGEYALGGAIVCGRKENGRLTLYRLSAYQYTGTPIKVFNPNEKLTWDAEKSTADYLTAFTHLRQDLLEHNTGRTENRIYIRTRHHTVKTDKPGASKAMRDWYILAPFYDPKTKTYRDSLKASDFTHSDDFSPTTKDFNPSRFVKKLTPYTLPTDYWSKLQRKPSDK